MSRSLHTERRLYNLQVLQELLNTVRFISGPGPAWIAEKVQLDDMRLAGCLDQYKSNIMVYVSDAAGTYWTAEVKRSKALAWAQAMPVCQRTSMMEENTAA